MNSTLKPLRVAAIGMEQRTYSSLQLFFRGPCKNNYILVEVDSADISIIDMDGYQASIVLQGHKKEYPNRPAILLSLTDQQSNDDFYVRKPIKISALTMALNNAQKIIQSPAIRQVANTAPKLSPHKTKPSTTLVPPVLDKKIDNPVVKKLKPAAPKIYKTEPVSKTRQKPPKANSLEYFANVNDSGIFLAKDKGVSIEKLQYQPVHLLQGFFQKAYNAATSSHCNILLEGPWRPIVILTKSKQVSVEGNFRHLYALSAMAFQPSEVTMTIIGDKAAKKMTQDYCKLPIDQFLWKLALRTSRGRVPMGTNFESPLRLKQWPNFTRTDVTPNALRIAALWAAHPTSLLKTAITLDIPLSNVLIFFSATSVLNLVSDEPYDRKIKKESPKEHNYRSLFVSFLNKLTNGSPNTSMES